MKYYLSHKIMGKVGSGADNDTQAKNCADAIRVADKLRSEFPKLVFYVPAENETFVKIAIDSGHLSVKAVLDIDCKIIDNCDGVIVYVPEGDELQGGRLIEYKHARATKKPVVVFHNVYEACDYIEAMYRREQL